MTNKKSFNEYYQKSVLLICLSCLLFCIIYHCCSFVSHNRAVLPHCVVLNCARSFISRQRYFRSLNIKWVSLWFDFESILNQIILISLRFYSENNIKNNYSLQLTTWPSLLSYRNLFKEYTFLPLCWSNLYANLTFLVSFGTEDSRVADPL